MIGLNQAVRLGRQLLKEIEENCRGAADEQLNRQLKLLNRRVNPLQQPALPVTATRAMSSRLRPRWASSASESRDSAK